MIRFFFLIIFIILPGLIVAQPTVNLGNDTLICDQRYFTLDAGNPGSDYKWSTDERTQTITVYESGTYSVTVNDGTGISSDEIEITILNEKYNHTNHWIFGNGAHIEFDKNSTQPSAKPGNANVPAGSAVATDEDGSLLFYSNGGNIYDKDGNVMDNGDNILGSTSSPENTIIFPKPGSTVFYYIFTIDPVSGLYLSEVDITANGGQGAVISKNKPVNGDVGMMTAVKPGDGNFVMLYTWDGASNIFRSFKINRNGIDAPIIAETGPVIIHASHMKVSVYGDKVAVTDNLGVHFYKVLDNGALKYQTFVPIENATGVEFSRGNNNAFVSTGEKGEIYHIKMSNADSLPYEKIYEAPPGSDYNFGDVQLGIDGDIYVASKDKNCIGKIEDANNNPVFDPEGFCLAPGSTSASELPNFPQHYFKYPQGMGLRWKDTCQREKQIISATSYLDEKPYAQIQYHFDLGDGTEADTNYIEHAYAEPGIYNIKLTLTSVCHTQEREVQSYIEARPQPMLPEDTAVCAGEELTLDPMTADSLEYLWDSGETTKQISPTVTGLYAVTINSQYCSVRDTSNVRFVPLPQPGLAEWDFLCEEKAETLTLECLEGHTYEWMPSGETSQSIIIDTAGSYYVFVIGENNCTNEDSIEVENICEAEVYAPDVFTPNGDGTNDYFLPKGKYLQSYELRVYNRWGEVVFATRNIDEGWDGFYRGKPADQGAYGFVILYASKTRYEEDLQKVAKGHLLLVR